MTHTDAKKLNEYWEAYSAWSKQFEEAAMQVINRVCGECGAEYSLQLNTSNHLVCPECGALGQGLPPEFEDMMRNRPQQPLFRTPEERDRQLGKENRWWKGVLAKRKQLQRYFSQRAARRPRPDVLRDLILRALDMLGQDASSKAILEKIRQLDQGNAIDINEDTLLIEWQNPKTGRVNATSFASFQNRVSILRKSMTNTKKATQ